MPSFARQLMPAPLLNASIRMSGTRLQWMKSHVCPCTLAGEIGGSPRPDCNTCHGRGRWWEPPARIFIGLRTFMHTSEAADEPGTVMDSRAGVVAHAEPTITIPSDVNPEWSDASDYDGYVEVDTHMRFETAMQVGDPSGNIIPYQQNLQILSLTAYDQATLKVVPVPNTDYSVNDGQVILNGYPDGTAFTIAYKASPVWIAWRRAGALPHTRMFGGGTDALPTRFRAVLLDVWTRARNQYGESASPQAIIS